MQAGKLSCSFPCNGYGGHESGLGAAAALKSALTKILVPSHFTKVSKALTNVCARNGQELENRLKLFDILGEAEKIVMQS